MGFWKVFTELTSPNTQAAFEAKYNEMSENQLAEEINREMLYSPIEVMMQFNRKVEMEKKLAMHAVLKRRHLSRLRQYFEGHSPVPTK
ncbi:MAG: hypothetical protein MJ016_07660 [Victivallaceae bacterium]|nr:hypothetical protein [Victivallaceae bacterium]